MKTLKTCAALMALTIALPLAAEPIDVALAKTKVAEQFAARTKHSTPTGRHRMPLSANTLQHVYTHSTTAGQPAVYVFNSPQGFVLAAADDAVPTLLGYSDTDGFDPQNIPEGLQYIMGEYARQIAAMPASRAAQKPVPDYEIEYTPAVGPLLETLWDQQDPYNRECPIAFTVGANSNAATGCMTTAIAQIMRYHKWPERGVGSSEMEAKAGAKYEHVERYYYNTQYNWDIMPIHKSSFTQAGATEVSKLMMDIAVGLNTTFGGTSSATRVTIIPLLLSYFNYDPGIEIVSLDQVGVKAFNHTVISDLQAGRPVYFEGGGNSAHAFVCDGYDGEGLFHINWGWSGTSNGYFRITGLSPAEAGTGGVANAGYSNGLIMIHNIKPYQGGELARPEVRAVYSREAAIGIRLVKDGSGYYFGADLGVFPIAPQYRNIRATLGLCVEKPDGSTITKWDRDQKPYPFVRTNGYKAFRVDLNRSWLEEGTKIHYIYQETGAPTWQYIHNTRGDQCTFDITRNDKGEWLATSDDMVYVIEDETTPSTNTVALTYNINLNNNYIGSVVVNDVAGQVPSRDFVPDYVKADGFPSQVPSAPATYTLNTSYLSTMPFGTNGVYNLSFSVGGDVYMWYASNNMASEQKNPDSSEAMKDNAKWRFAGDWLNGFTIQCVANNQYITTPAYDDEEARALVNASSYPTQQRFLLQHRDEGFYFKAKNFSYHIAHTQLSGTTISLFSQKYYSGNIVNITPLGSLPQPTGVNYTVKISGQPAGQTPQLRFGQDSYGHDQQFRAVGLDNSMLTASDIECFDSEILVGAETVYVKYTPGPIDYITYNVTITGDYPVGQSPQLSYRSQSFSSGSQLTATGLTLAQLSATEYANYAYTIEIKSSSIVVTYKPINYKTYTVNITGLPAERSANLFYNGTAVTSGTFSAGDLQPKELAATSFPDYGYVINIDANDVINVTYYGSGFYFDFTKGYDNSRNVLKSFPLEVSYKGCDGMNNIYRTVDYTQVTSTEAPIKRIVFVGIQNFGGVTSSAGQLNTETGEWTCTNNIYSVRFTGPTGDPYTIGMYVYLDIPACSHYVNGDVCPMCGHGFFAYTAPEQVTPKAANQLLGADGSPLNIISHTFAGGQGLIEFDAPLTTIGDGAFQDCTDLEGELTLSSRIRSIGEGAFAGCTGLSSVEFYAIPKVASTAFTDISADVRLALDDQSYICTESNPYFPSTASASYRREMKNEWGTIIVPFGIEAEGQGYELYELSQLDGDLLVLTKMTGEVAPGTPAVILMDESARHNGMYSLHLVATGTTVSTEGTLAAATSNGGLTLKGSYTVSDITDVEGFIIANNKFWNIQTSRGTNRVYNAPFRSYISAASPMRAQQLNISKDDTVTGLDILDTMISGPAEYYDLNGRRIARPQPGVNIVKCANGKTAKVIIK